MIIKLYRLKEQAELVIQENKFLLEQKYIQKDTVEELTRDYLEEIKELSHKVSQHLKDKNKSEHQLFQLKLDYSQLQTKHEAVIEELKTSIQYSKHEEKMKALESSYRCEIVRLKNKNEDLKSKLQVSANERERLALKVVELNVANNQLLLELEAAERAVRKYERRLMAREHQLENKKSKANTSIKTLKQVVSMAEKGLVENETLELQLHNQKYKTALAMFHLTGEEKRNKKLFKQIERYRDVSKEKVEALGIDLKTRERDMENVMETYHEEIYEIKKLLKEKQQLIEEMQSSKSLTMNNIEETRRTFQGQ